VTNKNSWGPNTLIKQGAKLTATWEDIWEELPSSVRCGLEERRPVGAAAVESKPAGAASLFNSQAEAAMGEHEKKVFARLRHDEPMQLDALIEGLEDELGSAEIFTALVPAKTWPGRTAYFAASLRDDKRSARSFSDL
jgi:DNA processing protein